MKLVYLYLKDYGPIKAKGFCFDSNYVVKHTVDTGEIDVVRRDILPSRFFSVKQRVDFQTVDGNKDCGLNEDGEVFVSAIVGKNGSGKTTILRSFFEIMDEACKIARYCESTDGPEPIPRIQYLIVVELSGKLVLYQNMPGHIKGTSEKTSDDYIAFTGGVDLIYYSPHYNSEHYLPVKRENKTFDISTSALLFEKNGNEKDKTFVKLEPADLFRFREMDRIFKFLAAWKAFAPDNRTNISMPLPQNFIISPERGAMERLQEFVHGHRGRDVRYADLEDILCCVDTFYNSLVAYVSDSLNWHHYTDWMDNQLIKYNISDVESVLLDIFIELGKKLHLHHSTPMDQLVPVGEKLAALSIALGKLRNIFVPRALMNDRGDYLDGISMFEILLEHMKRYPRLQSGHVIVLPTSDDEIIKDMGEVLSLQAKARGSWKTDYIHFEFEYHVSSGEMAFMTMYARIYQILHEKIHESGVDGGDVLLFMDEAEITLHPEWQQLLVKNTLWFLETFFPKKKFHVVFASHSPMLLSDIPSRNVVYLDPNNYSETPESFGANIFDLYRSGFFLDKGTVGSFAQKKIDDLVEKVFSLVHSPKRDEAESISDEDRQLVELIADKEVARYLKEWLKVLDRGKDIIR